MNKGEIMNNSYNYNSFWRSSPTRTVDNILGWDDDSEMDDSKDLIELAAKKQAVSNFVQIVAGANIPVRFATRGDSYTDGKSVVIGSKLDEKNFDTAVGLALHEGSHIAFTDFDALDVYRNSSKYEELKSKFTIKYDGTDGLYFSMRQVDILSKSLINYIEDRRIDYKVFKSSPGYKGYYHKMYKKYFYSKIIDAALDSSEYTDETFDSYSMRIINLHNKNTVLGALKGLSKISALIDLPNISRLKSTQEVIDISHECLSVALSYISFNPTELNSKEPESSNTDAKGEPGNESDNTNGDSDGDKNKDSDLNSSSSNDLNERQKKQAKNAVEKQKDFIDGKVNKGKLTKKEAETVRAFGSSNTRYKDVELDQYGQKVSTKVVVINKFDKNIITNDNVVPVITTWVRRDRELNIQEGLRLGTILGRKLQIRNSDNTIKYTRKNSGRIDKRMLSNLGFGNENVFFTALTEKFKRINLHISIDLSGSMAGDKFSKTMKSTVAVIKAASMTKNIDVQVTVRSTSARSRRGSYPLIMKIYDSSKDKISKVKLFKHLQPGGTTPESLTFDAIMDNFVETSTSVDSILLNYSDGAPQFGNQDVRYYGKIAEAHCRKSLKKIRSKGIKVLSYFIHEDYGYADYLESDKKAFQGMYGADAEFINPTSVLDVAKTLNKRFLEKN
tara:strand:- start:5462 stop:7480 length:2019 start_codon:yes stop_codon:yes gene_type:complete